MKSIKLVTIVLLIYSLQIQAQDTIKVEIDSNRTINRIDNKIYGFLLEHIYHSASNGIWGENIWNRSFEELLAYGNWTINDKGEVILDALKRPLADFRICKGKDYEVSLEFQKQEGNGFILIGVRDQNRERMLTNRIYWHLGTDNNTAHKLELSTGWIWHTPKVKTLTSDSIPGHLTQDEWTKVKVRCEGNHIIGWLNETKIFDRVVNQCPKDGAITLGGENCRVTFRNIQVKPLDHTNLTVNLNPVRHWYFIGNGNISVTHSQVLNHNTALRLHSSNGLAGVEQPKNFKICKNDLLKGSIYLKGTVNEAHIRLINKKKVISEQTIKDITQAWKEFPIELPSRIDNPMATLQILTKQTGDLYIDQVSLMHQSSIDNQGFRVELTEAVKALQPAVLRWPGGSFSEQYHFEDGIGNQSERKGILKWDDFDPLSFGTDEFVAFCHKVGAEPVIVIPIGYHNYAGYVPDKNGKRDWLQRALDWMEYCNGDTTTTWGKRRAKNGHPAPYRIKYWEIDNEVWKMDPKLYAEITRLFSIEMKKNYPDIKIIGCGCGRLGREGAGLDSIMIHDVAEYIDYISPHYYQTIDKYGNEGVKEYGDYLSQLANWISQSKNPDMKIYLSEWNLEGIDMRTGLFAGGFLNKMEKIPTIEMAAPALLLRHTSAPGWNNAFINFNQNGWFPAPNYVVLKLWRDHFLPNHITLKGNTGNLNMIATASDDKKEVCLKVVNPTQEATLLYIKGGKKFGVPTWEIIKAFSLVDENSMNHTNKIKVEKATVTIDKNDICLKIPPYSASVLTMKQ